MKDYASMSDFEINCEVLEVFNPEIRRMSLSGDNSCFYDCGPIGDGWHQIGIPDYCNNPADAWPIIVENKITIDAPLPQNQYWTAEKHDVDGGLLNFHVSTNPLRCAMIVFLMMKEGE